MYYCSWLRGGGIAYGVVNYSEYFPNGSSILQSQSNWWTTPTGGWPKEIMTPEWCRKITSTNWAIMFAPTRTMTEWVSFRDHLPSGVNISGCSTYSWYQSGFWVCSLTCWWWTQSQIVSCRQNDGTNVADSYCASTKPATSQSCNTQTCCSWSVWAGWYQHWWYFMEYSCPVNYNKSYTCTPEWEVLTQSVCGTYGLVHPYSRLHFQYEYGRWCWMILFSDDNHAQENVTISGQALFPFTTCDTYITSQSAPMVID